MASVKDIAWLAGVLEGEGSFYTYIKNNGIGYPELSVQSVDFDVILKISNMLDSNISNVRPYNSSKQNSYKVRACSVKGIQWMMTIYVLMSERRQAKIREVIAMWKVTADGRSRTNNDGKWKKYRFRSERRKLIAEARANAKINLTDKIFNPFIREV